MATAIYSVSKVWALAIEGPADINLGAPLQAALQYWVAEEAPETGDTGHHLPAGTTHPIKVGDDENLYLRIPADAAGAAAEAVATDA